MVQVLPEGLRVKAPYGTYIASERGRNVITNSFYLSTLYICDGVVSYVAFKAHASRVLHCEISFPSKLPNTQTTTTPSKQELLY